jgi:hypothetical protein
MREDVDLERFAEIGDPFVDAARSPVERLDPHRMARSPTRSRLRMLRAIALLAALIYDGAWVVFVERRPDLNSISPTRLALELAIPFAAAALAVSAVARRGEQGLGERQARVVTLAVASPALFIAATLLVAPPEADDVLFWRHAIGCMLVTAFLAMGPLALGVWAFRRAFVAAPSWRMASLGVACGALAAATMGIVCPISSASHIVLGHGVMMFVAGVGGAVLGQRLCRA